MASSLISVRPLASSVEYEIYFPLADQAFSPNPSLANARSWQEFVMSRPDYRLEQLRGAFRDGEFLGGYILEERLMRVGEAQLRTGCIAAVVTHPAHRNQGVGTALMYDAIDYALSHQHALLLLEGIPNFYHRFDYIDVFDLSILDIDRAAILAQPLTTHTVRPATPDDAEIVLALYDRHFGPYAGSFVRTLEQQTHRLQHRSPDNPIWLAIDSAGRADGYLSLQDYAGSLEARELVVDNWLAALALLQHHARLVEGPTAPTTLRYRLLLTAPVVQWMIDHLELPNARDWRNPPEEWVVRSQTYHHRDGAWMARLVHLPILVQAMLPEWQARWRRSLAHWSGDVSLLVGEEAFRLHFDGAELQLADQPSSTADSSEEVVRLTTDTFTQLVFGFRSVVSTVQQEERTITAERLSVLNILFPAGCTWIPSSDWF